VTLLLAFALWAAPEPEIFTFLAAVEVQDNRSELLAMAWVETRFHNDRVSEAGACCFLGVLGGRYGNPSCDRLRARPWLCVMTAQRWIAYWRHHCGKRYLDCYNKGWSGREGGTYGAKVRRIKRRFE